MALVHTGTHKQIQATTSLDDTLPVALLVLVVVLPKLSVLVFASLVVTASAVRPPPAASLRSTASGTGTGTASASGIWCRRRNKKPEPECTYVWLATRATYRPTGHVSASGI